MANSSKVSFTIRRPTPLSRAPSSGPDSDSAQFKVPHVPAVPSPLARSEPPSPRRRAPPKASHHNHDDAEEDRAYDSSDAESTEADELVTGFDKFGVERLKPNKKPANTPLVIPALSNKDWREVARKRRGATSYVPPSAAAVTGKDGTVGGLGTRDSINSGPVLSGLQVKQRPASAGDYDENSSVNDSADEKMDIVKEEVKEEESEDALALRAILAESTGDTSFSGNNTFIIPQPLSEADALKQDVDELPDAATLEDYARVPVAQFGAALLRGMGWTEGTAATRKPGKKGLIEPYLPAARPALLGIGAKEQEAYDDGSKKKKNGGGRPEKRYVPIVKQERSGSGSGSGKASPALRERSRSPRRSATSSRRASPDRYRERGDKDGSGRRGESDRNRDRDLERRRTEDRDRRRKDDRERDRPRERDRERRRDDDRRRDERRYDDSWDKSPRKEDRHDRRKDH